MAIQSKAAPDMDIALKISKLSLVIRKIINNFPMTIDFFLSLKMIIKYNLFN